MAQTTPLEFLLPLHPSPVPPMPASLRSSVRLLVPLLVLAWPCAAHAQGEGRTYTDTVPFEDGGTVSISNHEGSIAVRTWKRNAVRYSARVASGRNVDHPERTTVTLNRSEGHLALKTTYAASAHTADEEDESFFGLGWFTMGSGGGQNLMPVHYEITLPPGTRVTIDDHESSIEVNGLRAALQIDTHEGPIAVRRHEGEVAIDAHDSPIQLHGRPGPVQIDAHEGSVSAQGLRGRLTMNVHEVRADLAFDALDGPVTIDAHEGVFALLLPASAGFDLRTDFDDDVQFSSNFDLKAVRLQEGDEVNYRGHVSGGGSPLHFSLSDGQFALRHR